MIKIISPCLNPLKVSSIRSSKEWRNQRVTLTRVDNWPRKSVRINTEQTEFNFLSPGNEFAKGVHDTSSWKQLHGSRWQEAVWSAESGPAVFVGGLASSACRFWSPSWCAQSTGQLHLAAHPSTISTKLNFNSKITSLQQKKIFILEKLSN